MKPALTPTFAETSPVSGVPNLNPTEVLALTAFV